MRRVSIPVSASSSATTGPKVWPSKGFPCSALACSTNWPPLGLLAGVATDTLQPNSYGALALPLANAFDLGGMQRIDFGTALPVILKAHPHRQGEQAGKAFPERLVARDLAPDIADHAAQPDAQELERAPSPLELVRMRVAPNHECGTLGDAPITLPQRHVVAPRQFDQFFQGAMAQPRIGRVRDRFRLY